MARVWSWLVLAPVQSLVADLRTPEEMVEAYRFAPLRPVQLAESISRACAGRGLNYPTEDRLLLAYLRESATWVDPATAPRGAVLGAPGGLAGIRANGGVIESNGEELSLVDWTPGRYADAWLIPGVLYAGWEGAN